MALKSTIFKVKLSVNDLDRPYYAEPELTLARHPSETDLRLVVRLIAFALHADPALQFSKGLSSEDEPTLCLRSDTGEILTWIDIGQPEPKQLRKAAGKAKQVVVYTYQRRSAEVWWRKQRSELADIANLALFHLDEDCLTELIQNLPRHFSLSCTRQENQLWLARDDLSGSLELFDWRGEI